LNRFALFLLLPLIGLIPIAQAGAEGVESSSELLLQLSSLPEAKIGFTQSFTFPFMQGESPLTSGNNFRLSLTGEISPISLNGIVSMVLTPIAFIELSAGARLGTGWPLDLFGNDIYGIGLNYSSTEGLAEQNGSAFDGLLYKAQTGGAFQFDLAAVFPGDWNHVVFLTYHEINYSGYTRASGHQSWYFEADEGENVNGFNYYGNFLVGYQMPKSTFYLNLVGFLAEMELYLYDTPGRKNWGDDMIRWTFSNVLGFNITDRFGGAIITQFWTRRNYLEPNWEDLYYRNRTLNTNNPLRLEFYRVAGIFVYKF